MNPIIGLKFREYYNENNINNIPVHEIRGIIDDCMIVLLSKTQKGKEIYSMIDIYQFGYFVEKGIYRKIKD